MNRECICCGESEPHTFSKSGETIECCNACYDAGCTTKECFKVQDPGEPLPRIISTETGIVLFDEDAMGVRS